MNTGSMAEKYGKREQQYIDMFEAVRGNKTPAIEWITYYVMHDEFPNTVDECDAYVISGSKYGVYEELPWVRRLTAFVCEIVAAEIRLTGVCFGHQIVAHALGGKAVKFDKGFYLGKHSSKIVIPAEIAHLARDEDYNLAIKTVFDLNIIHGDQVVKLPDSAEIIATSEFCEFAGLYYPEGILTFQGHPEYDYQFLKDLINFYWDVDQSWADKSAVESVLKATNLNTDRFSVARFMLNFMTENRA